MPLDPLVACYRLFSVASHRANEYLSISVCYPLLLLAFSLQTHDRPGTQFEPY